MGGKFGQAALKQNRSSYTLVLVFLQTKVLSEICAKSWQHCVLKKNLSLEGEPAPDYMMNYYPETNLEDIMAALHRLGHKHPVNLVLVFF
jgi:hypothetical protein